MKNINVILKDKKYGVRIKENSFDEIENTLIKREIPSRILAVTDAAVLKLHQDKLNYLFESENFQVEVFRLNASEKEKNLGTVEAIYKALLKNNFDRDSAIIAIGGGITGDIAGFAASTYMRGIKYIQAPTTILASVDSSVGGKTGVNFNNVKNFIGSFYQPEFVIIDPRFFTTLPEEEIICGLGEAIKTSFLAGGKYFAGLPEKIQPVLEKDSQAIEYIITNSVQFKAGVVAKDEKEKGLRKILNFGHTFAHALEGESGFAIKHGQAVIFGIAAALFLSYQIGLAAKNDFEEGLYILSKIKNKVKIPPVAPERIYNAMLNDKKNKNGRIKFVLLKSPGNVLIDVEAGKKGVISAVNFASKYFYQSPVL